MIPIPVPVGTRHTQVLERELLADYTCEKCGFEGVVRVHSFGRGEATAPLFIGQAGASDEANRAAEADLTKNAETLLATSRCPSCDSVDETAVARERSRA